MDSGRGVLSTRTYEALQDRLVLLRVPQAIGQIQRHLRARGIVTSAQRKVRTEMDKARIDIENKLIPKGADGQTPEWILAEMDTMDNEMGSGTSWKAGKLSMAATIWIRVIVAAYAKYCAAIVAMTLKLFNNPKWCWHDDLRRHRIYHHVRKDSPDWARAVKGITEPEIIIPSVPPYLKIKVHSIPVDPFTRKVDLKAVKTRHEKLAAKYKIGLHVDCCLGSFIGSSVIMYRDAELRRYQYYVNPDWSGGVYASPRLSGLGALIAGKWAAMQYMGSNGYLESCRAIVTCARTIADTILYILGSPPASVMSQRGWHLNALTGPAAVHIACTRLTVDRVDVFIADLKDLREGGEVAAGGQGDDGGSIRSILDCTGLGNSSAVGPAMVGQLATAFLDTLYKA
ncbi:pyridoxal phosphate-dependent transferase [Mycena olivaceomarginata]|nr:pyridoxal phosphate-dependent transferase [Mycena olivaceomarginata]